MLFYDSLFPRNADFIAFWITFMLKFSGRELVLPRKMQEQALWNVERVGLTSSSHVLTGPDWLETDKRDLHRQYETHYVESAVSCRKRRDKRE